MKKYMLTLIILVAGLFHINGQTDVGFTNVPVINGKVVFEQFIPADPVGSAGPRYTKLQDWTKKSFAGSPLLSGIRYDDKSQTVTVSSRIKLNLPVTKSGVQENMIMSYRFDATVTNAGCVLVVRDITYQTVRTDAGSFFPKTYSAEETITDQAAALKNEERELRNNLRKETLRVLNKLYADLSEAIG
ncbi:MAG: DUF4468 domain-containing protein [Porphyromonadaceae bacterium]|nr:DUF4468 domain-containing protein [Porphyromonadaceae bacterium]